MGVELVTLGLVCADVMVRPVDEWPERGKLTLVPQVDVHLGGLAGVTATVYAQLGGKSAFIGRIGRDGFGKYVLNAMESQGVDVSAVTFSERAATAATAVMISSDGERTFLHNVGAAAELTDSDVDLSRVRGAKVLHWGGPAVTPGLDGAPIARVLRRAREAGIVTSMDTCYDGTGKWFSRIEEALPQLDIAMSSLEEARKYTGRQTPEEIAAFYRSFGAEIAVVKLGADGIFASSDEGELHVPAHTVEPIDTTGAGDAACAGFLYGYINGWGIERSLRLANAVGAETVQCLGGAEAISSLDQALKRMETE